MKLKQRYRQKWSRSNARERLVLAILQAYMPPGFTAKLTGLGAGSSELLPGRHESLEQAFDITIYYNGGVAALVDVTGADTAGMRLHSCRGRCVGSWKLEKARKYKVVHRVWVAFVNDDTGASYWLSLAWLDQRLEAPFINKCKLYEDERLVYCVPPQYWKRFSAFLRWLTFYGPVYAELGGEKR